MESDLPNVSNLDLHLVQVPPFFFPLTPTKTQTPTIEEWQELWKAWDLVTLQMIPKGLLHEKPIHLRHPCIFYLGEEPRDGISC